MPHTEPADALKRLFRKLFECPGRDFGHPSRGVLGVSDGNEGVQWNAGYHTRRGAALLGVNLEGMKYDDWPVARFIERELSRPLLLTRYRRWVAKPEKVIVRWSRDAWQIRSRVRTRDQHLGPTPIALDRLDDRGWEDALRGALGCLDPERRHRGRRMVEVTRLPSERRVEMAVTPHLQFGTVLAEIAAHEMRRARNNLDVLHEFVRLRSKPHDRRGTAYWRVPRSDARGY